MGRLIDGDALFRSIEEAEWYNNADRDEIAEKLVLNAPTIEERRQGYWVKFGWSVCCSECDYEMAFVTRNFCPNCGAKMMEGEQHEQDD